VLLCLVNDFSSSTEFYDLILELIEHYDVKFETDKMTTLRNLFEKFVANCRSSYSPSDILTIDKSVLPFRGRCSFRVYFGSTKPKSYGIKAYCMADSTTFYGSNMEIYLGAQDDQNPFDNSPAAVVTRLIQPVPGSGRTVITDN